MKHVFDRKNIAKKPIGFTPHRERLHEIIFEAETKHGKIFDIVLMVMILLSILTIMLESIQSYYILHFKVFIALEWIFTAFFTIEYILRLYSVYSPRRYMFSFFGMVDLLSILPSYLTIFIPGIHSLMIIRGLRLLRIFRIFKLDAFIDQGNIIVKYLIDSKNRILIFTMTIIITVCIMGSAMYLIEKDVNPNFDNIPRSIYWSIVTITTVGYGDISPVTSLGQFLAAIIMLLGYVIIALPSGMVTAAMINKVTANKSNHNNTITCKQCSKEGHDPEAIYCNKCGYEL